jgi:hypothetical protein
MIKPGAGRIFGWGTTVGNGIEGWAPGAFFIDTDASAGANQWRNDGTKTTASWTAVSGEAFLDSEELTFGTAGSSDSGIQYDGTNFIVNSATAMHLQIGGVGGLAVDDSAISGFAAATDTAGQDMYAYQVRRRRIGSQRRGLRRRRSYLVGIR